MNIRGKISEISKLENCVLMSNHSYNADFLAKNYTSQIKYKGKKPVV